RSSLTCPVAALQARRRTRRWETMRIVLQRYPAILLLALGLASMPSVSTAQVLGTVTGTVKDASGAVLPGVTVEASSPALIEKVRTGVTDGAAPAAHEKGAHAGHGRRRPVSDHQPSARRLRHHVHADGIQYCQA